MNVTPTSGEPTDFLTCDVTRRIMSLLSQRAGPWLAGVQVQFENGTAKLSGAVRSYHERQLCITCCQHVPGVHRVVDELQVDYPTPVLISTEKSVDV